MSTISHPWDLPPKEAVALQKKLAAQIVTQGKLPAAPTVTGVDASYRQGVARAAAVTFSYPRLEIIEVALATRPVEFPYVPGLLSFREGPVVLDALGKLTATPSLLIFDGQGIAHPRRLGLASHIGLWVNIPTIGCAKNKLCGQYQQPGPERGSFTYLVDGGQTIGAVVRTRHNVKPVFVSVGHRVDLSTSIEYVLNCGRGYKLPEPTRWADKLAGGKTPATLKRKFGQI